MKSFLLSFLTLLLIPLVCLAIRSDGHSFDAPSFRRNHHRSQSSRRNNVKYCLQDKYCGEDILNSWNFFAAPDPTHGMVDYQNKDNAIKKGLAYVQSDGTTVLAVDNTTWLAPGANRASVRISSPKTYSQGLFIADFWAMPYGCSVWPAWWTVGPDWPNGGEIDVLEGVHNSQTNQVTLHTSNGCSTDTNFKSSASGALTKPDCAAGTDNAGCAFIDSDSRSYGKGFNLQGGGVYAHLWDSEGIKVWFFSRSAIPKDIQDGEPKPYTENWGKPVALWRHGNSCDMTKHFYEHAMIIDTTLCGDWAGNTYKDAGCPGTCADAVKDPKNFDNARWKINYIAVYQAA
ncbi:hypothetical protein PM082_010599 [Marasmius tenuissimus]|nr:hypothetical protein PM082_010599 [Marasmius tenuissimus]